jgi:hypothetical protein
MFENESRILAPLRKYIMHDPKTTCWVWTGAVGADGYTRFRVGGRTRSAHRVVYNLFRGPIPGGLELDHLCRQRRCVNPRHLEPVPHAENMRRADVGKAQRAKTHCPNGHSWDTANTRYTPTKRVCRACERLHQARWRLREGRTTQSDRVFQKAIMAAGKMEVENKR